jgi:hypothetical protein
MMNSHSTETYTNNIYEYFDPTIYANVPLNYIAPVHLPDGAIVTGVSLFYFDNTSGGDIRIALRKILHEGTTFNTMCTVQSSGEAGDGETSNFSIAFPVISNLYYNYSLVITSVGTYYGGTNLKFKSARIAYTMNGPL